MNHIDSYLVVWSSLLRFLFCFIYLLKTSLMSKTRWMDRKWAISRFLFVFFFFFLMPILQISELESRCQFNPTPVIITGCIKLLWHVEFYSFLTLILIFFFLHHKFVLNINITGFCLSKKQESLGVLNLEIIGFF